MTATATSRPCLDCGTTGGYIEWGCTHPKRTRGRCKRCYSRAYHAGKFDDRRDPAQRDRTHPAAALGLGESETLAYMLWHDRAGQRQGHAVHPDFPGQVGPVVDQLFEHAADLWMQAHPEQVAHFDNPQYARFGSPQERAA
jgi:hypothetical protein